MFCNDAASREKKNSIVHYARSKIAETTWLQNSHPPNMFEFPSIVEQFGCDPRLMVAPYLNSIFSTAIRALSPICNPVLNREHNPRYARIDVRLQKYFPDFRSLLSCLNEISFWWNLNCFSFIFAYNTLSIYLSSYFSFEFCFQIKFYKSKIKSFRQPNKVGLEDEKN